jgi:transposase-like protein
MSSNNVRRRGKIHRQEWPKIAKRFQKGESLAEIARRYGCTPPAIRYIIGRTIGGASTSSRKNPVQTWNSERDRVGERVAVRAGQDVLQKTSATNWRLGERQTHRNEIWRRINSDIATFLAAMDTLFVQESEENYERLLAATDRLLWASARTRLELERVLAIHKVGSPRRRASG